MQKIDTFINSLVTKYNYKPLNLEISKIVRKIYQKYILPSLCYHNQIIYTINNIPICKGFKRIVIGDYGAYIEFSKEQAYLENFIIEPGQEYRLKDCYKNNEKYIWYRINSTTLTKIYYQLHSVTYADYKIGYYYVSAFDVIPQYKFDIKISYFYQIRNFLTNMIPISTAMWDPLWYHNFTRDPHYQFKDKRGIWNGIRAEILNPSKVQTSDGGCRRPCLLHPETCDANKNYKQYLDSLDFNNLIKRFNNLNEQIKQFENTTKDYTFVLIVYETPNNPCSERNVLIPWFQEHGYNLQELVYPIV